MTTKAALIEQCRAILASYNPGATLNATDATFMASLLAQHQETDQKIGCGVASFQVERDTYGKKCFWLTRTDGTRTDFSFHCCITPRTAEKKALLGLRNAVEDQVLAFRAKAFARGPVRCAITGTLIANTPSAHVDHDPPFRDIVKAFTASRGIALGSIAVQPTRDGDTVTRLADQALAADWSNYHREHARLRMTAAVANLSRPRKDATPIARFGIERLRQIHNHPSVQAIVHRFARRS